MSLMEKARVIREHKTNYILFAEGVEIIATVRGSFLASKQFPKVGDYVVFSSLGEGAGVIEEILPRTSTIMRKDAETGKAQIIVTNVDLVFIVMGLDNDFNLSRLERYLLLVKQSDVKAVVVLNKIDAVPDYSPYLDEVKKISGDVPVYAVSALNKQNMDILLTQLVAGSTAVLLGSSGAGKSTITNWLLNTDTQKINSVREDDSRGRHTTTARQLFTLPSGAFLIDTPGMRELGILEDGEGDEEAVFSQIDELSMECEFSNCDHLKSKGCAVLGAIEMGDLSERQLFNYLKLKQELVSKENKNTKKLTKVFKKKNEKLKKAYNSEVE